MSAILKLPLAILLYLLAAISIAQDKPAVVLFATGGTIAMKIDPVKRAPVPALSGEDLLATVPDIAKYARVEAVNVANVPSGYMDPVLWSSLTKQVRAALARPTSRARWFRTVRTRWKKRRIGSTSPSTPTSPWC